MTDSQQTEVVLYDAGASSYAQKIRIALREKGIPFTLKVPEDLANMLTEGPLHSANPRVEVPVLLHKGNAIFDSTIIMEYLEDCWPTKPLLPKTPMDRARARMIEDVCDTQYEACNWGISEVKFMKRAEGELAEKLLKQGQHHTKVLQEWLTGQLGDSDWFSGESFGWADIAVAPMVNRSVTYGIGPAADSALGRWHARVREVPSVAATFEEYNAAVARMPGLAKLIAEGKMKRQYRDHRLEWMIKAGGMSVIQDGIMNNTIRFTWPENI